MPRIIVTRDYTYTPTEECRIVNLHVNLEEFLGISPSELVGVNR